MNDILIANTKPKRFGFWVGLSFLVIVLVIAMAILVKLMPDRESRDFLGHQASLVVTGPDRFQEYESTVAYCKWRLGLSPDEPEGWRFKPLIDLLTRTAYGETGTMIDAVQETGDESETEDDESW